MLQIRFLTSLLGKTRGGRIDDDEVVVGEVSSTLFAVNCVEDWLNTVEFSIADDVCALFFLSNGFRGGRAGGMSWLGDWMDKSAGRLGCL